MSTSAQTPAVLRHLLIGSWIFLAGCVGPERDYFDAEAAPPKVPVADAAASTQPSHGAVPESFPLHPALAGQSLSLGRVLALVAAGNPDLMASSAGVAAVAARRIDAGKLANPEGGILFEDFSGQHPANAQTTLLLSQAIPLTGKLGHQQALARGESVVAQHEYDIKRLEVFAEAARTFIALLVAQQRTALASEQLALVERLSAAEEAQVEAGQLAPFERSRALAAVAEARLRVNEARRDVQVLRQRLVSFWSGDAASFREVAADLVRLPPTPALPVLLARLDNSPEIVRSASEIELRRAALALERARATPDIAMAGGIRRHDGDGTYDFVAGVTVPLPVVTQNQSAITEAARRQQQAQFQLAGAKNRLRATISEDYERLTSIAAEIEALQKTLIPASENAVSALREGYKARKFRLSELLIAEQSLAALRDKLLTTLGSYHLNYVDLEQLLGGDLYGQPTPRSR
ncbi:MAG TPA: TolC family protein [Xanthobacteraceae bacterium]|nr:TolC family protein [Xanthobacteraceae bacterium]